MIQINTPYRQRVITIHRTGITLALEGSLSAAHCGGAHFQFALSGDVTMKISDHVMAIVLSLFSLLLFFANTTRIYAADMALEERGRVRYQDDCGGCHGTFGRGNGTEANGLTIPPSDLTVLAKDNQKQFPEAYIRRVIDGRGLPASTHGQTAMPVWGRHYRLSLLAYSEKVVQRNINELVAYLKSIQVE